MPMGSSQAKGSVVRGASRWGLEGGAHQGPGCVPVCLQSSGNVWVTHEEMETLATSTKTVSLPLGPRNCDTHDG